MAYEGSIWPSHRLVTSAPSTMICWSRQDPSTTTLLPMTRAGTDHLIWYASYGSNVNRARFLCYLQGGTPAGASRPQRGARDQSLPLDDAPCVFRSAIRFAGYSKLWDGAPAFLEHRQTSPGALGRRYLITKEQFADVVAQENSLDGPLSIPFDAVQPGAHTLIPTRVYDTIVGLDPVDGIPVATFTSSNVPEDQQAAPPSAAYLGTILRGLVEVHELDHATLARHLHGAGGVAPTWSVPAIEQLLNAETTTSP